MASEGFISKDPQIEDYWRGIILFGRNVASYKFSLAKSLLELNPQSGQLIKLSDLAPVFAKHICEHLKNSPKQTTSASSTFLESCRRYGIEGDDKAKLAEETVRLGFNNVIDAFHVVGSGEVQRKFYIDERKQNGGIRITDEFSQLVNGVQSSNLAVEVESRWRLVERAWELGVSRGLIAVEHDQSNNQLFTFDSSKRRKDVTSCRSALNGYQKGKCFYCFTDIRVDDGSDVDVDHFFPDALKKEEFKQIDGVWNLVLSCIRCNRGVGGKFDKIPHINLLARLSRRNEYLIGSHHPLRETLIRQTGTTESERKTFLNDFYNRAKARLFHDWSPIDEDEDF